MSADVRLIEILAVNTKERCVLHPTTDAPPLAGGEIEIAGKRYVTPERLAQLLGCTWAIQRRGLLRRSTSDRQGT